MRLGFHISIAGGFSKVVERAKELNCQAIQVFARNPRGWNSPPLDWKEVEKFKKSLSASEICPLFVHLPYLPNLAGSKFYKRSFRVLIEDLKRTEILGGNFLIGIPVFIPKFSPSLSTPLAPPDTISSK